MARKRKDNPVGRHGNFSSVPITGLQDAIEDMLREYGDVVYIATEEGLDAAAYTVLAEIKDATPRGETKMFYKRWKVEGSQGTYKLRRYIGNSTQVEDSKGNKIALANIFEYSTVRGNPFIKRTFENSIPKMAAAVVAKIKQEV